MPELPEVETVRLMLIDTIPKSPILDVRINYPKIIQNINSEDFSKRLIGQTIKDVQRKGKYLIFILSDDYLISHLRMEGKYIFAHDLDITKHDHILFYFQEGILSYNDTRKFGTMHLFAQDSDIYHLPPLNKVGPEPFSSLMSASYLYSQLQKRTQAIKTVLLDQSIISGLGNIYVDEVLFRSLINPQTKANKITVDQSAKIITEAKITLTKAIELGGTTIRTFKSGSMHGRFQNELLIHGQKVCPKCGKEVEKIYVGGRGTYHCSACQK